MFVFDLSVYYSPPPPPHVPPSIPPFILPPSLSPPAHSSIDHPDADREQCIAWGPAGWWGSGPWGRGARRRRGRRPLAQGSNARRICRRSFGWVRARSRAPGALGAVLGRPPPAWTPGHLNVWDGGSSRPHGPRPPSSGLSNSSPAAPQHTQRKLEPLRGPLHLPTCLSGALIGCFLWGDDPILIYFSFFSLHLDNRSFSLKDLSCALRSDHVSKHGWAWEFSLKQTCTRQILRRRMENRECFNSSLPGLWCSVLQPASFQHFLISMVAILQMLHLKSSLWHTNKCMSHLPGNPHVFCSPTTNRNVCWECFWFCWWAGDPCSRTTHFCFGLVKNLSSPSLSTGFYLFFCVLRPSLHRLLFTHCSAAAHPPDVGRCFICLFIFSLGVSSRCLLCLMLSVCGDQSFLLLVVFLLMQRVVVIYLLVQLCSKHLVNRKPKSCICYVPLVVFLCPPPTLLVFFFFSICLSFSPLFCCPFLLPSTGIFMCSQVRKGGTGSPALYGGHHVSGSTEMGRYMVSWFNVQINQKA